MGKKQGPVRIAVGPHGSQNRDQTAFHGSLLPFESKPKKKKKCNEMDIIDRAWVFRSDLGFLLENIHFKLAESFESFIVERVILFARSRK